MSFERRAVEVPERPVLVVALEGWIDPGFAAEGALGALLEEVVTKTLVVFDGDELIDHRARRAHVAVHGGLRAEVVYPAPRLRVGTDRRGRGIAFLVGPEPDYKWRPFAAEVVGLANELGCWLVVGLGAFPAPVPHTRPIILSSTASSTELAERVGYTEGTIVVPTGIADVLGASCAEAGIPAVGLWARVPHYVGAMPYLPASLALVEGLLEIGDLTIDLSSLREQAAGTRRRVDELIAQSEEHQEMVRQLEEQYDEAAANLRGAGEDVAASSGDELIAELERYLRGETDR